MAASRLSFLQLAWLVSDSLVLHTLLYAVHATTQHLTIGDAAPIGQASHQGKRDNLVLLCCICKCIIWSLYIEGQRLCKNGSS